MRNDKPREPGYRPTDGSEHARLRQIDSRRIKPLWSLHNFDGPLNGLAEYEGRKVWFDFHHMDEDGAHYFYTLYPLSSGQAEEAELWQATRGRYNDGRWVGRDEARHDRRWNGPALHGVEPLGWFTNGNPAFYPIRLHPPTDGQ
jgi:hypothetical protein